MNKYSNCKPGFNSVNDHGVVNADGVYKNGRLMHTVTSLIGSQVEVELLNGQRYEGIFKTFSPEFDLVIFAASPVLIDNSDKNASLGSNVDNLMNCLKKDPSLIIERMVVPHKTMVKIKAIGVDLEYATAKKTCLTDAEISANKMDSKLRGMPKELVPWKPDDDENSNFVLGEDSSNPVNGSTGWGPDEMLQYNEKKFNINTTYTEEMPEYTIQLQQRNDDEYRKKEAEAESIARDIEKDPNRVQRLAKENDLDEETRFSAVVTKREDNVGSPRSEVSHSSRDDRRDSVRHNADNSGYRTQGRQGRNRNSVSGSTGGNRDGGGGAGAGAGAGAGGGSGGVGAGAGGGGGNRNSSANDNWRNPDRMNSARFNNQPQPSSYPNNTFNPKSNNQQPSQNAYNGPPQKYGNANANSSSNQFSAPAGSKSSYSAVSARHTLNDSLPNENDSKPYKSNRGHSNKADHNYQNEDSYNRKSNAGQTRRDFKPRTSSRIMEHDMSKPQNQPLPTLKPEADVTKVQQAANISQVSISQVTTNETTQAGNNPKATSPVKGGDSVSSSQHGTHKGRSNEDNSQATTVPSQKQAEHKKQQQQQQQHVHQNKPNASNETSKQDGEQHNRKELSPVVPIPPSQVSQHDNSPVAPSDTSLCATSSPGGNSASSEQQQQQPTVAKSSSLNPNAKSFKPRAAASNPASQQQQQQQQQQTVPQVAVPAPVAAQQYIQNPAMVPYPYPQQQMLSTTPPSNHQYIQITPHMQQQHHQHLHPQQTHPQMRNSYQLHYNLIPQMVSGVPQYIPVGPNGIPIFSGHVPAGVPSPAALNQTTGQNQSVPSGQLPSHHMVSNGTGGGVPAPNQSQQQQQGGGNSSRQYRKVGGSGHGSGPNHQSQQYARQPPQHMDYNQQSQVASVTGQPIMTANVQQASLPVAYSNPSVQAPAHHHHHHPSQQQQQQANNMAGGGGMPSQQPPQHLQYHPMQYPANFSRISYVPPGHAPPMNLGPQVVYDQLQNVMICDACPTQMSAQMVAPPPPPSIPNAVAQNNANLQSVVNNNNNNNISSSASSNAPPNSNQGVPSQQAY